MGNLFRKHFGVAHWVQGQEGLCEARRERCLWLRHTLFRPGHLRCVTRDEMKHGLVTCEL